MDASRVLRRGSSWRAVFSDEMPRSEASSRPQTMIDALEALSRLREGNRRFATNQTTATVLSKVDRTALISGQEPFAIILGCSDSRVPAELVFDQGFGDLFVIRVAGNIVAPSQVGSVEFAASRFGTRLVVVMGHTQCGAITATLEELYGTSTSQSANLRALSIASVPSVATLLSSRPTRSRPARARSRSRQRACVGGPPAPWLPRGPRRPSAGGLTGLLTLRTYVSHAASSDDTLTKRGKSLCCRQRSRQTAPHGGGEGTGAVSCPRERRDHDAQDSMPTSGRVR